MDESKLINELIETLKDRHWLVREKAIAALVEIGEPVVSSLLHALDDPSAARADIAQALGKIGDVRAVVPLIELLDTTNFWITQEAAKGLGNIGDPRAVFPLIDVFRLEWDDTETITTWQEAAKALAAIGEPAVLPLIAALDDEDDNVRSWSAETLGDLHDPKAVDPLIQALRDENNLVRAKAAEALGNIRDRRAIEPLALLLQDVDSYVRLRACYALGNFVDLPVFSFLVSVLNDPDEHVRGAAVINLGRILGMQVAVLDPGPEPENRQASIEKLKNEKGNQVVALLLEALKDSAGRVRAAAASALGAIGDEQVLPALYWVQQNDIGYAGANKVKDSAARAINRIQERVFQSNDQISGE